MKLYFEDDRGIKYEVQRAAGLQEGDILLFTHTMFAKETIEEWEQYLSKKFDRKVIILDSKFRDILVVPPVLGAVDDHFQTDSPN